MADELVARGWRVAALARREDRLRELEAKHAATPGGDGAVAGWVADVTDPATLEAAVRGTLERWGRIDLVVANAGFAVSGPLAKLSVEDYRRQLETNVFGVLHTIYATREALFASKGILAVIGSVAGHVALPYNTAYSMSKFCVRALAYGLRNEWRTKGVAVVHVSPGFIDTDIVKVDNRGVLQESAAKALPKHLVARLEDVVPDMVRGILARRREVTVTRHGKLAAQFVRLFPGASDALLRRLATIR
jgi:NADP-dependent 3-hydroxy acid dehydrogenase YdfG